MANLFAYGSLMYSDVLFAVTGAWRRSETASLADHRVHMVKGKTYPALLRVAGAAAEGRLYRGLSAADLSRLDAFEGASYVRLRVLVITTRGRVLAFVYVWRLAQCTRLSTEAWRAEDFARDQRRRFATFWLRRRRRLRM